MIEKFTGSFTQQEPIPDAGIKAAMRVLQSGRLHRYNVAEGEIAEAALIEEEFADLTGARYCVALGSGGYALACAMRAAGVTAGARVLTNAFTLAPVPGSIAAVGAVPVFVGVTNALVIDLDELETKAASADWLMLSHMRGHICDMDRLMQICVRHGVTVIEDCAHTMGAAWRDTPSGRHGIAGCFSTQTYKHINSGEGGFLITDDAELAARAIMLSGSYMLFDRHRAAPEPEVFERVKYVTPNMSGRMDNLRAAILRPQLADLPRQVARWKDRYSIVEAGISGTPGLQTISRDPRESYVGSSIQFLLLDWTDSAIHSALSRCAERGVELKWFGAPEPSGYTSRYDSWRYAPSEPMPDSDRILRAVIDMRLPLTFSEADCQLIAQIIRQEVSTVFQAAA